MHALAARDGSGVQCQSKNDRQRGVAKRELFGCAAALNLLLSAWNSSFPQLAVVYLVAVQDVAVERVVVVEALSAGSTCDSVCL